MTENCPHCGQAIDIGEGQPVKFCPHCGKSMVPQQGPSALEKRLRAERKPKKKYQIIQEALAANPDDFDANQALLFHGRLHEPMKGRQVDFSIIKSHLLSVLDTPDKYTKAELDEKYEELLRDPQLLRTMALAADADAFFDLYVRRLALEYVDLFICGDSKYTQIAFGIMRSQASMARTCAEPVKRMLAEIAQTGRLTEPERAALRAALRDGYAQVFGGHLEYLDE